MHTLKVIQLLFKKILLPLLSFLISWANAEITTTSNLLANIRDCRMVTNGNCPDPDVQFFIYTRENPTEPQLIDLSKESHNLTLSNFNPKHKTKIIIHGYNTNMHVKELENIRKEYLIKEDCNIIAVNWPKLGPSPCYVQAVFNARFVGKCTAQMVEALQLEGATDIHILGFSLGAHIAGFTAQNLRPYKLPRITGLDPAGPLFQSFNEDDKLDAADADFVDVIHTNALVKGKLEQSGHVDFYVNGGTSQPGCSTSIANITKQMSCNHHRAPAYFAESINSNKGFYGWPCNPILFYLVRSCPSAEPLVIMGDEVPSTARGIYEVNTASEAPFALGIQ